MARVSTSFTATTMMISLFLFTLLLSSTNAFEILSHYEILTGDCEMVLHCRATLTVGRMNGDVVVAAGYVIRNTFPAVPPSEYVAIGVIPVVKNWTHYAVNSVQLAVTYHADKSAPVQCQLDTDSMAMAIYHSMFMATRSCSDIGQPACEQFRLLGPCTALPSATATMTPSNSASLSSISSMLPVLASASASVAVQTNPQTVLNASQLVMASINVSPTPSTTQPNLTLQNVPVFSTVVASFSAGTSGTASSQASSSLLPKLSPIPPLEPPRFMTTEPVPSVSSVFFVANSTPDASADVLLVSNINSSQTPGSNSIAPATSPIRPSQNSRITPMISNTPTPIPPFSLAPLMSVTAAASKSGSVSSSISVTETVTASASASVFPLAPTPTSTSTAASQIPLTLPPLSPIPSTSSAGLALRTVSPSFTSNKANVQLSVSIRASPVTRASSSSSPIPPSSVSASVTATVSPSLTSSVVVSKSASGSLRTSPMLATLPLLSPIPSTSPAPPSSSSSVSASPSISATSKLSPSPFLSASVSVTPSPISVFDLSPIQSVSDVPSTSGAPNSTSPSITSNNSLEITAIGDTAKTRPSDSTLSARNATHSQNASIELQKLFAVDKFYILRDLVNMVNLSIVFPNNTTATLLAPTDAAFIRTAQYLFASPDVQTADQPMTSFTELNRSSIQNILGNGVRFRNESLNATQFAQMIFNYHIVIDPFPEVGTGALLRTRLGVPVMLTTLGEAVDQSPATPNGVISRNVIPPLGNFNIHAIDALMIPDSVAVNMTRIYSCQM